VKQIVLCVAILGALVAIPTLSDTNYGSIAVIYFTQEKIVVAADSRATHPGSSVLDNSECKIAAFKDQVVFVSGGAARYIPLDPGDPVPARSNLTDARSAYEKIVKHWRTSRGHVQDLGDEWGKVVSAHFESMFTFHRGDFFEAVRRGNGHLTGAENGGLDRNGELVLFQTLVVYDGSQSHPATYSTTAISPSSCPHSFCAVGNAAEFREFIDLTSERAKNEIESWKPGANANPADYDILRTIRLVDLVIRYGGNDVGGKVDAVQLDRNGSIRWFARKDNCPPD
jgi:hypothetical protein